MKFYEYIAVNKKGERIKGVLEANSPEDVAGIVTETGLSPIKISEKINLMSALQPTLVSQSIPSKEKVTFFREFATMISAGLPIDDALDVSIAQSANGGFKRILEEIVKAIRSGSSLASAMEKFPKVFSLIEVNLIKAGEVSGKLDSIMQRLADDAEKQSILRGKVRGALSYPIFVLLIAGVVVVLITLKLVPAMQALYQGFGAVQLPLPTQILVSFSNFISNDYLILIGIVVIVVIAYRYYVSTPEGGYLFDRSVLKVPILGSLIAKYQVVTFIKTYNMLLASGVPVVTSLNLVGSSLGNKLFSRTIINCSKELEKGVSLANALSKYEFIPSILWRSVAIGEETGKTEDILTKIGNYFETQVNDSVNNLTRLLEPLLLVVLGSIVGFIAVAIYLPIYSFSSVVH